MLMLPTGQSATQAPQPLHDSAWMLGWVRAPAGGKADGLLLAAVLTALAEHLGSGQTACLDMGHILPGCLGCRPEHRRLAGADALGAEGALAAVKIHRGEARPP
jgi:hypothetical protein